MPGSGQLLGHKGCVPVGAVTSDDGRTKTFEGSEAMIETIEEMHSVPKGSLKFLEVLESPTFPGPDGKSYRVKSKTYNLKTGEDGRYVPLEVEAVR